MMSRLGNDQLPNKKESIVVVGFLLMLLGGLGGLTWMSYWLYMVWIEKIIFSWTGFSIITSISIVTALVGYLLLKWRR